MSDVYSENVAGSVDSEDTLSGEVASGSSAKVIFPCTSVTDFPTVGKVNALYIDKSASPNIAYRWDSDEAAYIMVGGAGGEEGVTDYTQLENLPSINGVILKGNLTSDDLNIEGGDSTSSVIYSGEEITEDTKIVIDPDATADKIPQWYNGTLVTSAGETDVDGSAVGDYYINTDTFDVYYATDANTWELVGNIKGGNGSTGIFFGAYDGSDGEPPEDAVLWIDPDEAASGDFITTSSLATALAGVNNQIQYYEDTEVNAITTRVIRLGNILIQSGFSQFSGTTSVQTATIYFSKALGAYAAAPTIIHADSSATPQYVHSAIGGTTAEQFTAYYIKTNSSGTVNFRWIAIGTVAE